MNFDYQLCTTKGRTVALTTCKEHATSIVSGRGWLPSDEPVLTCVPSGKKWAWRQGIGWVNPLADLIQIDDHVTWIQFAKRLDYRIQEGGKEVAMLRGQYYGIYDESEMSTPRGWLSLEPFPTMDALWLAIGRQFPVTKRTEV